MEAATVIELPPGFRFHPTDQEIVIHYLLEKVKDRGFTAMAIGEVDLNKSEPWDLPEKAKMGENEWFFFFQKDRKYASGMRTNRATESGYWKATGKDKEIYKAGKKCLVGMKKTLVFHRGRAPKGVKTNWVIHEYRLEGDFSNYNFSTDAKEKWVVCRVFHKKNGIKTSPEVDSFVDHLLDGPTLPPLVVCSRSTERPSSSFATEHEVEANVSSSKLTSNNNQIQILQHDQENLLQSHLISSYSQFSSHHSLNPNPIFCPETVHPNSAFPNQSPPLVSQHQHQVGLISTIARYPIKGADHDLPTSPRTLAPNVFIGGREPKAERMCKMETFSLNNSIVSHSEDTRLSNEMATEITSVHSKEEIESKKPSAQEIKGLYFTPSMSDLVSLWSY